MTELLKYSHNKDFAIFDMGPLNLSFSHKLFHFFSYIILIYELTETEQEIFVYFLAYSV